MNYCPECGHHLAQYTTKPSSPACYLSMLDGTLHNDEDRQHLGMSHIGDVVTVTQAIIDKSSAWTERRGVHEPGSYRILNIDRSKNQYPAFTSYRLEKA